MRINGIVLQLLLIVKNCHFQATHHGVKGLNPVNETCLHCILAEELTALGHLLVTGVHGDTTALSYMLQKHRVGCIELILQLLFRTVTEGFNRICQGLVLPSTDHGYTNTHLLQLLAVLHVGADHTDRAHKAGVAGVNLTGSAA